MRVVVDLCSSSETDSEGSSSVPASKSAPYSRKTKELEAAARKAQAVPSKLVMRERRSKTAADTDAGKVSRKRGGSFIKRGMLPAKKLSSAPTRPTTVGLAPAGKSAVEKRVDAIEAQIRAEFAAKQQKEEEEEEKQKDLAGGTSTQVVSHTLAVDPDRDLSVEDMEKYVYAYLAQADLALEAINANMTVEQLVAAKEAEAKTKAVSAANEAAKAKCEYAMAPTAPKQPADAPIAPLEAAGTPAGGVKRSSGDASAPSSKRTRRRKPEVLGTRDG